MPRKHKHPRRRVPDIITRRTLARYRHRGAHLPMPSMSAETYDELMGVHGTIQKGRKVVTDRNFDYVDMRTSNDLYPMYAFYASPFIKSEDDSEHDSAQCTYWCARCKKHNFNNWNGGYMHKYRIRSLNCLRRIFIIDDLNDIVRFGKLFNNTDGNIAEFGNTARRYATYDMKLRALASERNKLIEQRKNLTDYSIEHVCLYENYCAQITQELQQYTRQRIYYVENPDELSSELKSIGRRPNTHYMIDATNQLIRMTPRRWSNEVAYIELLKLQQQYDHDTFINHIAVSLDEIATKLADVEHSILTNEILQVYHHRIDFNRMRRCGYAGIYVTRRLYTLLTPVYDDVVYTDRLIRMFGNNAKYANDTTCSVDYWGCPTLIVFDMNILEFLHMEKHDTH